MDAFRVLRYAHDVPSRYVSQRASTVYPASTGGAFWRSVVEYGGPEVCLERELWCGGAVEAVEVLRQ